MAKVQVNLCGKESGSIWSRKPVASSRDGIVCEISNTKTGFTSQGRHLQFTRVAFGYHGNWFVAGDQQGNLYHFSLTKNRFRLAYRAGQAVTALESCLSRPSEVLMALADYSIKCVDIDSGELVATLRGHEASVKSLSLHSSGRFVLAVSSRDCVLWDLDSFARCRTLNGGQEVGVQDVFFQPLSNVILTCFKDDSIHAWEADTLEYKYQLPPPFGPTPHYRAFATPRDGRLLVGGGRSSFLHVWALESRQLLRVVQLPSKIRAVRQLLFLPSNFDGGSSETLGFLAQDGILRFINVHSCKQLFQIGSHDQMLNFVTASPDGCHLVAVSEQGNVLLYNVASLAQDLNKPPAPLVKIMEEEERATKSSTPKKVSKVINRSRVATTRRPPLKTTKLTPKQQPQTEERGGVTLDTEKLKSILKGYGEYPSKYRAFIWRCLLKLPENHAAYSALLAKGTHPSYVNLHQEYPLKSRKLLRVLQRALSCLAHWSAIFGETRYLPGLVFPFVKLFQNNQLVTFEILATILLNWCGHWFEYFPHAPLNVLAMVENCLAHHDAHLLEHFIKHNITSHQYAWPLLSTLFSEVLSRDEWLRLWDNTLSSPPSFLLLVVVAYLSFGRQTLFHCSSPEDFEYFFHHRGSVDIGAVIQEAYRLQQTTLPDIHPERMLEPFAPLTKGTYPVFNKYPRFIVDYQLQERERIRREELQYLQERQSTLEMERLVEVRRAEEEAWYRQQELLMEAEQQRRTLIQREEQKLSDQRARLQAMKREVKVRELKVLDAARRRFMQHQKVVKEAELHRLDDEVQRKVLRREEETRVVLQDLETRGLELERQRGLLEQELQHCQHEMLYRLRVDQEAEDHRGELEQSMLERAVEEEGQREREKLNTAHTRLARVQAEQGHLEALQEAEARRTLRGLQREARAEEVAAKSHLNRVREMQLETLVNGLERERQSQLDTDPLLWASPTARGEPRGTEMMVQSSWTADHSTASRGDTPLGESPGLSALKWSHRREELDRQEANLLSRVRQLRRKVVGQMNTTSSTHGSETPH